MAKLQGWSSGTTPARDAEAGFLDHRDELLFGDGPRIVEHPGFALIERCGSFLHARASLQQRLYGLGAAAAVHAFDLERHGIHLDLLFPDSGLMIGSVDLGAGSKVKSFFYCCGFSVRESFRGITACIRYPKPRSDRRTS